MEEEHPLSVRRGDDPRPGVAEVCFSRACLCKRLRWFACERGGAKALLFVQQQQFEHQMKFEPQLLYTST